MKAPKFPIRWKLIIGFVGLTLLVLLVVLFAVSRILDNRIREDINSNFREAGKIFAQLQEVRFRQLRQTATLVAEMPYLKAAISTGDVNTVNNQIRQELVQLLHFDPLISDTLSSELFTMDSDSVGLVIVFDRDGTILGHLNEGEQADSLMADKAGVKQALQGRSPRQSYIWKRGESYFNVITIPVFIQNQVIAALTLGYPIRNIEVELLARLIEYQVSYFVDDKLLATSIKSLSEESEEYLVDKIKNMLFENGNLQSETTVELELENQQWLVYVIPMVERRQNAGITGYYSVAQSLTEGLAPLRELQQVIFLIGLGGILLAVVLGVGLTHHLTRPINLLLEGIKRIENDKYDQPVEVVSRDEFGQLTRTFNKLVSNIKENIREKETLLSEIHHRVKNNLAVILGLLQLEEDKAEDANTERILKNSQLRIHSMSTVHELLYQAKNFNKLSFDDFVSKMVFSIQNIYSKQASNIEINLDVEDIKLNVNQAVPCGLIINELITNAFKHAYTDGDRGTINVSLKERDEEIFLKVSDNGAGLPSGFRLEENDSLGFTLVKILIKQIEADIHIVNNDGTDISVVFKKQDKKGGSSTLNVT